MTGTIVVDDGRDITKAVAFLENIEQVAFDIGRALRDYIESGGEAPWPFKKNLSHLVGTLDMAHDRLCRIEIDED